MVVAELPGRVPVVLEQLGDRRILVAQALLGARQSDLAESRTEDGLAGDERRMTGRAALLGV
jgi:hypothetical protein